MSIVPCKACLPVDCTGFGEDQDIYSLYSLQQPPFIFFTNCPPGYSCSDAPYLLLSCCGDNILVDLIGVEEPQRTQKINAAFTQCANLWLFCGNGGGDGDGGGDGTFRFFYNQMASCTGSCPDGSLFRYQVAPGWAASITQAYADAAAGQFACQLVTQRKICIGSISPDDVCVDSPYIVVVGGSSAFPLTWSVSSGSLPTGLGLVPYTLYKVRIAGTPTVIGSYPFSLKAVNKFGNYMVKAFTINVIGIVSVPDPLPGGTTNDPYPSVQFSVSPIGAALSWSISAGALPGGLTLDASTGVLSGTPTADGNFTFTVRAVTSLSMACSTQFTIVIAPETCWIDAAPAGGTPLGIMAPTGVGVFDYGGGTYAVMSNRTVGAPFAVGDNVSFVTPEGGVYGDFHWVSSRPWYRRPSGVIVEFGPVGTPITNRNAGKDVSGIFAYNWLVGGAYNAFGIWSPSSGDLAIFNNAAFDERFWTDGDPVGSNGYVFNIRDNIIPATSDGMIWSQGTGRVNAGLPPITLIGNWVDVGTNGHFVIHLEAGVGLNYAYYYNGATTTLIYNPVGGVYQSRINSSDIIAGVLTAGTSFYRWETGVGVSILGLPPGAASGADVWITDAEIILVNASNGVWFYWSGAWGDAINLLSPADQIHWTHITALYAVTQDGYAVGKGTFDGTPNTYFWCKFCTPSP